MATRLCASFCLDEEVGLYEVDRQIAAANSIPEGAPVGTIARRPDGEWLAERKVSQSTGAGRWCYLKLGYPSTEAPLKANAADSWPVIYDPTTNVAALLRQAAARLTELSTDETDNYHLVNDLVDAANRIDPTKPDLDWFPPGEEPTVPRPDPTAAEVEDLAKWLSIHIGTWPEDEWELRSKPNYYHDRARELLDFGYRKVSDPTAQQERAIRGTVEDALRPDDVELLETDPMEFVRRTQQEPSVYELDRLAMESIRTTAAQQEPADEDKPEGCTECGFTAYELEDGRCDQCPPPKPRTPRVVDRLGVDEQGSRWRDENGLIHSFTEGADGGRWKTQIGGSWYPWAKGVVPHGGEYTEILEPRVLASLAYNEAREGAVWSIVTKAGVRRLFQCQSDRWHTRLDLPGTHWTLCENFGDGPYTEVLGDPS